MLSTLASKNTVKMTNETQSKIKERELDLEIMARKWNTYWDKKQLRADVRRYEALVEIGYYDSPRTGESSH